jgi:hypothetical protein
MTLADRPARRMTPTIRAGLRAMASYWSFCLESHGHDFEDLPPDGEAFAEINAALKYLGLPQFDPSLSEEPLS